MAKEKTTKKGTCSFCGKNYKQVEKLIAGPNVYICNECVALCVDIVYEDQPPMQLVVIAKDPEIEKMTLSAFASKVGTEHPTIGDVVQFYKESVPAGADQTALFFFEGNREMIASHFDFLKRQLEEARKKIQDVADSVEQSKNEVLRRFQPKS